MEIYTTPELDVVAFDTEEVIATSEVGPVPKVDEVVSLGVDEF